MSDSAKKRSLLFGGSLGVAGTLALVVALGLVTGAGATADATPPSNTAPPTISAVPQLGQSLAANAGSWTGPQPIIFSYQWLRCDQYGGGCADIAGGTNQTFTLTSADVGHAMRARVRAKNPFGSNSATTVPTAAVSGTANGCPIGDKIVSITQIGPPARLLIDGMHFTPFVLRRSSHQLLARFHVSDTCN